MTNVTSRIPDPDPKALSFGSGDLVADTLGSDLPLELGLPLGYHMNGGKIAVIEDEAERVRQIYRRYLELSGVNALVRDLRERDIRTKSRLLATGATRGGILFGRGSLFYLLRNRIYIGEVKYKDEILPGEQPSIMDRALFDAVQQKLTEQWTTQSTARNVSDHLLTGLLFDDAGHRMVPTHATKAGVRYCYYVSLPHLHGESRITPVGSVSRVAAIEIENVIVKSLQRHLITKKEKPSSIVGQVGDRKVVQDWVVRIDVHEDHLAIRLRSPDDEDRSGATEDHQLSIPWQKPPSRKSRQILLPRGVPRSEVRPTRIERRARLVSAISRGRRWLEEVVSGSVTDVQQIATRQKCSVRQVNMTISLAFLAPDLVRAAVEGRLPRGIGVERLRDAPAAWGQQFEVLGLNPNNQSRI